MSDEPDYKALFDILIRALASNEYWVSASGSNQDSTRLTLLKNKAGQVGDALHRFAGAPETCVAMIAAVEAEKRLST